MYSRQGGVASAAAAGQGGGSSATYISTVNRLTHPGTAALALPPGQNASLASWETGAQERAVAVALVNAGENEATARGMQVEVEEDRSGLDSVLWGKDDSLWTIKRVGRWA